MRGHITTTLKAAIVAAFLFIGGFAPPASMTAMAAAKTTKTAKKTQSRLRTMGEKAAAFNNPNFAYPETVEKDATPVWEKALAEKDGPKALQAALQLIVARGVVSQSGFNANIAMLDSAATTMPAPWSSLFYLLQADMYADLWQQNRWTYSQRTLPTDTYPADPLSWSTELFAKKTLTLIKESMKGADAARGLSVDAISGVIEDASMAKKADFSVYDFMVYNAAERLNRFGQRSAQKVIPFRKGEERKKLSIPEECTDYADKLLENLINVNEKRGADTALAIAVSRKGATLSGRERTAFLKRWMERMADSPASVRVICDYYDSLSDSGLSADAIAKEQYAAMEAWLARFSGAEGTDVAKYVMAKLSVPGMKIRIPQNVLPLTEAAGEVSLDNTRKAYVLVYRLADGIVTSGSNVNYSRFPGKSQLVAAIPVEAEGSVPFSAKTTFILPALPAGRYLALPSPGPHLAADWRKRTDMWSGSVINVSDISLIVSYNSTEKDSGRVYVVDSRNQKPVAGARVDVYDNRDIRKGGGTTDSDGSFPLPEGYLRIEAEKGGAKASVTASVRETETDERVYPVANILTDLSIYRPGDKVRFALTAWTRKEGVNTLLKKEEGSVVVRDANYNPIDTVGFTTDGMGRANGEFQIPREGLLGTYTLMAVFNRFENLNAGTQRVQVAEYKTPGFIVALEKDSTASYKAGETIRFRGTVKTYSGMPLADTEVDYSVVWQPWWRIWGGGDSGASYGGSVRSGSDGKFTIELPTDGLKGTEYEFGIYTLTAEATSASGETQSTEPLRFSLGRDYSVRPSVPDRLEVDGDEIKFNVPVYDILGLPAEMNVDYTIERILTGTDGKESLEKRGGGTFRSPILRLSSSQLPSGKYRLTFNVAGDTLTTRDEVVLYRKSDTRPPYATPLWVPDGEIVCADSAKSAEVVFGSGFADSWILAVVSDKTGIVRREWINISEENTKLTVAAPGEGGKVWVTLSGTRDFDNSVQTVTLVPASSKRRLEVEAVSFRDRISAGEKERWSFRFTVDGKPASDLAAFAVMSDKALNALAPFTWTFNPGGAQLYNQTTVSHIYQRSISSSARFAATPKFAGFNYIPTEWNTYGYSLIGGGGSRFMMRNLATTKSAGVVMMKEESVVNEMYDSAVEQPMMASAAAVESEEMAADGDAGGAGAPEKAELRPVEMPLLFFMPNLTGNEEGTVDVEFDVADFNTTWQFQMMGYTDDLLTAGIVKDAVASKQVMVKSNPPRYLRTGDKAGISALLFNNTSEQLPLSGEIEVFNPFTGEVMVTKKLEGKEVAPSGSLAMEITFTVPSDVEALGIRAYARGGNFTDGEQTVVAVLPSSTPVVESTQFYIGADSKVFTTGLPRYSKDSRLTLKYCDNPLWECVLALPSISTPDSENALTLINALYANALAFDIAGKYPSIRSGLERVLAAKDSTAKEVLKSKLEKDAELKAVELVNTPWVNNARTETMRMRSLDRLLDSKEAETAIASQMKSLRSLQNSDGGWSWCRDMESSEFITREIVGRFGAIARSATLPKGASAMVERGIAYCDRELYKSYVEAGKKFSTEDMLDYLYDRSFFEGNARKDDGTMMARLTGAGTGGFATLRSRALKEISEEWAGFSISGKAKAAILLSRSKGYQKTAGKILESLRQYASKSEEKGWWYDNLASGYRGESKLTTTATVLQAYSEIEPAAEAVDGLRQWLVLQKETEDWGSGRGTVEVIGAILAGGTDWSVQEKAPVVRIGDPTLSLPAGEMLTGTVTMNLDPATASGKQLTVEKGGSGPAWGGVVSQYIAPIKDVKGASCQNLKIEKSVLLVETGETGTTAKKGEVKVGDKIRVTLTITCDKDMDYVALIDERAACLEPAEQTSVYMMQDGLSYYREVRDTKTSFFIGFLPKGVNVISYDCHADRAGSYSLGIATVQSQYSPLQTAHSEGRELKVTD